MRIIAQLIATDKPSNALLAGPLVENASKDVYQTSANKISVAAPKNGAVAR